MGIWGVIFVGAALGLAPLWAAASEKAETAGFAQNRSRPVMLAQVQPGQGPGGAPQTPGPGQEIGPAGSQQPVPSEGPGMTPSGPGQQVAPPPQQQGQGAPGGAFPPGPGPGAASGSGAGPGPGVKTQGAQPPKPSPMMQPRLPAARRGMLPGAGGGQSQATAQGGMISLNFDDADVFSVVQTVFGDILRVNYVIDPKVKGRVTFRSVAPIPRNQVIQVMEVILRINAIGVVEESGLYRIVPIADVSREPAPVSFGKDPEKVLLQGRSIIQVVPITYLQSTEVTKLIAPFLSATAVALDVPKSNQIIIVDTDASVKRILQLIETFDNEKQKKKRAAVHVYAVQNGKARDIANLLNQIFLGVGRGTGTMAGTTGLTGGGLSSTSRQGVTGPGQPPPAASMTAMPTSSMAQTGQYGAYGMGRLSAQDMLVSEITRIYSDDIINSVIILATPEDYELIKETIAKVDIVPRQVVIEGVIAQISMQDELTLGLAYSLNVQIQTGGGGSLGGFAGLNPGTLQGLSATTQSGSGFTFVGADVNGVVRAYINALASDSKAKLLAAPHILVSDNREARIQVGQQVPLITSETYGSTTVSPQRTIQYKDIGIILKVKPQINASGLVNLEMSQEVSTFQTITLYANETQIILDKTEASSNLVVQDGQSIIIGGLIREDLTKDGSGIPLLRDIPVLGWLFGSRHRKTSRVEIVILLTPHVIKNQREAAAITNEYVDNMTTGEKTKGGLTREELLKGGVQLKRGLQESDGGSVSPLGDNVPDVVVPLPGVPPQSGKEGATPPSLTPTVIGPQQ